MYDGPVLEKKFQSFVGVDPIPVAHGLTVGEYAQMVNGEKWLPNGMQCNLKVAECLNYNHTMRYSLPVKPSPNLPNDVAIYNYPSICYFEGTDVSVGERNRLSVSGSRCSAEVSIRSYSFTPQSKPGAKTPPHLNKVCYGFDLENAMRRQRRNQSFLPDKNIRSLFRHG